MSQDLIRCPSCRGSKKVAKLGGMIGECNSCNGDGKIKQGDKPKLVEAVPEVPIADMVKSVSQVQPVAKIESTPVVKVDPKRAIYKRKKA